jgi:hypothetical protein
VTEVSVAARSQERASSEAGVLPSAVEMLALRTDASVATTRPRQSYASPRNVQRVWQRTLMGAAGDLHPNHEGSGVIAHAFESVLA